MEEVELLQQLRSKDKEAQRAFVRMHTDWMYSLSMRMVRDPELAQDCVQDAFLQAFRYLDSFAGRSSLKTWLYRITFNAALLRLKKYQQYKKNELEQQLDDDFDWLDARVPGEGSHSVDPQRLLEQQQNAELVRAKIYSLPDNYRNVLLLRDIEEKDTRTSAAILGINENLLKVRLNRARAALKKLLEPVLSDYAQRR